MTRGGSYVYAGLNSILGLQPASVQGGGLSVRVQAGVKLLQLHRWLAERGLEVRESHAFPPPKLVSVVNRLIVWLLWLAAIHS